MYELMPFGRKMHPVTFDPFRGMDEAFSACRGPVMNPFSSDIIDLGESYEINAELPGFSKEDIKLEIESDCLTFPLSAKPRKTKISRTL